MIFGIGCSFTTSSFAVAMPKGKTMIHATLDPADLHKDVPVDYALVGDAQLTLRALIKEVSALLQGQPRGRAANSFTTKNVRAVIGLTSAAPLPNSLPFGGSMIATPSRN